MLQLDAVIPVPESVSRRAWECAGDMLCGGAIRSPALWHWLQAVAQRDPGHVTWAECGALFRLHRQLRPVRA